MPKKKKSYIRKDPRCGIASVCLKKGKSIRLTDREVYMTSKVKEIKALDACVEIVEYTPEVTNGQKKADEEKREKEAAAEAKKKAEEDEVEKDAGESQSGK